MCGRRAVPFLSTEWLVKASSVPLSLSALSVRVCSPESFLINFGRDRKRVARELAKYEYLIVMLQWSPHWTESWVAGERLWLAARWLDFMIALNRKPLFIGNFFFLYSLYRVFLPFFPANTHFRLVDKTTAHLHSNRLPTFHSGVTHCMCVFLLFPDSVTVVKQGFSW